MTFVPFGEGLTAALRGTVGEPREGGQATPVAMYGPVGGMLACPVCHAVIEGDSAQQHADWHDALSVRTPSEPEVKP
jgi:hypothetical protein